MGNKYGKYFSYITFGESHGKAVGCVIDGIKPNLKISESDIQSLLDRRKPGQKLTTKRKEQDKVEILSGVFNGKTTGHPICLIIWNKDQKSKDYKNIENIFRPGHADITFQKKYGIRDYKGGGRQSARTLAANTAAGAIAKKQLEKLGIKIKAKIKQVGKATKKADIEKLIKSLKGDSIGCLIEVTATGIKAGLGSPQANKLNAEIAKALMSINAAKGVEIGSGFQVINTLGSKNNDIITKSKTKTNNAGGILGGISNGMPIVARVAIKPASSIYKQQSTINKQGKNIKFKIEGRHDPCPGLRAPPIVEAMLANVLYNAYLENEALKR